jgi:hypothetical protein
MWLIDRIAEAKIKEAGERGEFENLPGAGKPLRLEDDAHVPEHLRAGYRLLKNAGFLPPDVQVRKDIADVESLLSRTQEAELQRALSKKLNYLFAKLQQCKPTTHNLTLESQYYERLNQKMENKSTK